MEKGHNRHEDKQLGKDKTPVEGKARFIYVEKHSAIIQPLKMGTNVNTFTEAPVLPVAGAG